MPSSAAPQHMGNDTLYDIDAVRREWERRETPPGPAKVSCGARTHPPPPPHARRRQSAFQRELSRTAVILPTRA